MSNSDFNIPGLKPSAPKFEMDSFEENPLDYRDADIDNETTDKAGVGDFESIDLLGETVRLYRQTRKLLTKALTDSKTPMNQQASVINTLGTLLKTLAAQQTDLYNAERLKRLEAAVIRIVASIVPEKQDEFLRAYEEEVKLK